jgi:glyoxylase-like metal-dependent hydrolase (beta-lactamase superfamily II)
LNSLLSSGPGPAPKLPGNVQVIVRDWLSANHVLLKGRDDAVLVDTGYATRAPLTLNLVAHALRNLPLAGVVNTHCHSDHMGGNAAVARAHACPIAIPEGEVALVEAWDETALLLGYCDQTAERFTPQRSLRGGETYRWGDLDWHAIATPGHDMGALCFYNAEHRVLISGDALWEYGFGFVMPREMEARALPATRATLEALARLDVDVVIPGHGAPFADFPAALQRAFSRVEAFEKDPSRLARHAVKVVLSFALLDRGFLALDALPGYVERVGMFREFNARFFRKSPGAFADWLVSELERAGAVRRDSGKLLPLAAAAG